MPRAFGDLEIVRLVARGGQGAVYEARRAGSSVRYAVKVPTRDSDAGARTRFRREAELLARADRTPGVVKVHSLGETADGSLYLVLDFVDGEGLDRLVERSGPLEARRAAGIALALAKTLAAVHERGIVHRDVKPSNILLDQEGKAWLTDFGLARAEDLDRLTRTGQFLGTVAFVAPEQAAGDSKRIGPWTDAWSLGAVLFHSLSGEPPDPSPSALEVLARLHDACPARDVRDLVPGAPPELAAIVARALAKETERRYATCGELALDLESFLEGRALSEKTSGSRIGAPARRRAGAALGAVLGLAAAALVATLALRARADRVSQAAADAADSAARAAVARAETALKRGAPEEAARLLREARATAPLPPAGAILLGRALLARGDLAGAEEAVAGLAESAALLELRGDLALAGNDPRRAADLFARAIKLEPRSPGPRAKQLGAAGLAGPLPKSADEALRSLVPDPQRISSEREQNVGSGTTRASRWPCSGFASGERLTVTDAEHLWAFTATGFDLPGLKGISP